MAGAEFTFKNIRRWKKALKDPNLMGKPVRKALLQTGHYAIGQTKERTPSDRGRARNSFGNPVVDRKAMPRWVKIGSNLPYIRDLEFGTRPHWPPLSALQPWARRHGFPAGNVGAFLVARVISQKGTKAHHMLRDGIKATGPFFKGRLAIAAKDIEKNWKRAAGGQ